MKRITLLWLCLLAAIAAAGLLTSTALAEGESTGPVFKEKVGGGTEKTLAEGEKVALKLEGKNVKFYVPALNKKNPVIVCVNAEGEGAASNNYVAKTLAEARLSKSGIGFKECSAESEKGEHCSINGSSSGSATIKFERVLTRIGFKPGETKAERESGLGVRSLMTPEVEGTGGLFAKVTLEKCSIEKTYEVKGKLIGTYAPVNTLTKVFTAESKTIPSTFAQELNEIEFPQYNESTKKLEKQIVKGELEFNALPGSFEGKIELFTPAGTEMKLATK